MFHPRPVEDEYLSSMMNREGKQQHKIIDLKKYVYSNAAKQIANRFILQVE